MVGVLLDFDSNLLEDGVDSRFNRGDHNLLGDLGMGLLLVFRDTVHVNKVFLNCDSSYFSDLFGYGGREQKSLTFGVEEPNNTRNSRLETKFEHLISFIKDKGLTGPHHI